MYVGIERERQREKNAHTPNFDSFHCLFATLQIVTNNHWTFQCFCSFFLSVCLCLRFKFIEQNRIFQISKVKFKFEQSREKKHFSLHSVIELCWIEQHQRVNKYIFTFAMRWVGRILFIERMQYYDDDDDEKNNTNLLTIFT